MQLSLKVSLDRVGGGGGGGDLGGVVWYRKAKFS